ncbi:hypothetical protein F5884DRAFT_104446 [Xylogone sp. PMI_703]|nr:hypothetical protein F5884DRAFT_104446 [Xylogone sp. PMI_703]
MVETQENTFSSSLFEFRIGPHKKPYVVSNAAFSRLSKPLDVMMMNGGMIESTRKSADLEHVDEAMFDLVCQYAYTRYYRIREPKDSVAFQNEGVFFDPAFLGPNNSGNPRSYVPSPKQNMWNKFQTNTKYQPLEQNDLSREDAISAKKNGLLYHAKVYVFADQYEIAPLRDLSIQFLKEKLDHLVIYPTRCYHLADLIRYIYQNTSSHPYELDSLRALVSDYAACVIEELSYNMKFQQVLEEVGAFSKDLS